MPAFSLWVNMSEKILIGKILKPQGIKGEVKVKPILDKIERITSFDSIFIGKNSEAFKVEKTDVRFGYAYITFSSVKTRNDAELLRNKPLYVTRDEFGKLDENSYLLDDLIGLSIVYEGTNICAGKIVDIEQFGSADVIHVLSSEGREYQLPFLKAIFRDVDINNKVTYVDKSTYEEMKI